MREQKATIRKQLLNLRKRLPAGTVDQVSKIICNRAFSAINWSLTRTVCTYEPAPGSGEIDTAPLLSLLSKLPKPPSITMVEPHTQAAIPKGSFDVIIVPVVGFNEQNHRLGQGGGWYDRFLANQPQAYKIGLAHAHAKVTIPHEHHDVPLDLIVTEES